MFITIECIIVVLAHIPQANIMTHIESCLHGNPVVMCINVLRGL